MLYLFISEFVVSSEIAMGKLLYSASVVLRLELFVGLVGLILFLGYLGFTNYRSDYTPYISPTSPVIQN